jgi:hypothetical protein
MHKIPERKVLNKIILLFKRESYRIKLAATGNLTITCSHMAVPAVYKTIGWDVIRSQTCNKD